jgi:RimJ/RimL family protein N-acetyltransferase
VTPPHRPRWALPGIFIGRRTAPKWASFSHEAQGKGYGFESLKALCDYAFHQGGIRRLTATVTAGNVASRRLLEKARFRLEGELRESYYLAGRWQNDWLFGLLQQEYLNNNS